MKIKYEFVNGDVSEVDVNDEIGTVISDLQRKEENLKRNNRRHCYSLDALKYGDKDIYVPSTDTTPEILEMQKEESRELYAAFSKLSKIQQRRLLMLASGLSIREISRKEDVHHSSVAASIEAARRKLKKFL